MTIRNKLHMIHIEHEPVLTRIPWVFVPIFTIQTKNDFKFKTGSTTKGFGHRGRPTFRIWIVIHEFSGQLTQKTFLSKRFKLSGIELTDFVGDNDIQEDIPQLVHN